MKVPKIGKVSLPEVTPLKVDIPKIHLSKGNAPNLNLPKLDNSKIDRAVKDITNGLEKAKDEAKKIAITVSHNVEKSRNEIKTDVVKVAVGAGKVLESASRNDFNGVSDGVKQMGEGTLDIGRNAVNLSPTGVVLNVATDGKFNKTLESAARLDFNGVADGVTQMGQDALDTGRHIIDSSPVGDALNKATNGEFSKTLEKATDVAGSIVGGVAQGMASNLTMVKDGVVDIGEGVVTGNPVQILNGVANAGLGAVMTVKDFTPSGLASNVAMSTLDVAVTSLTGNSIDTSPKTLLAQVQNSKREQYSEDLDLVADTS
jgi:hypothetical protein